MYYKLGEACDTNWGSFVLLQNEQTLLQIRRSSLLQIEITVVTKLGSFYTLGQPLLQNRTAITTWGKLYCKLGQALQIRTIIPN